MPRLLKSACLISFLLFFCSTFVFAEDITITTYYPSPYGSYNYLQVDKLGVGDNNGDLVFTSADVPTTSGNVWVRDKIGIGTTNPQQPLHIYKTSNIYPTVEGTTNEVGWRLKNSQANWTIFLDDSTLNNLPTGAIGFYDEQDSLVRLMIDGSGKVGIGTAAPTYQLQLSTDSAAKPTTNTWTIASDKRIKKNISDFTDGLNIVMKLKPRIYQYNSLGGKGYDDTDTHIGFVAQEVEPIAPYMVETGKGTIGGVQVSDFKNYQGHALPFILVRAIQEQQGIIKAQQLQIDGLKVRLDKLEKNKSK